VLDRPFETAPFIRRNPLNTHPTVEIKKGPNSYMSGPRGMEDQCCFVICNLTLVDQNVVYHAT
jgi:hypothetical protein